MVRSLKSRNHQQSPEKNKCPVGKRKIEKKGLLEKTGNPLGKEKDRPGRRRIRVSIYRLAALKKGL